MTVYDYGSLAAHQDAILSVARRVQQERPAEWADAHRAPNPEGSAFIRSVAAALRAEGWNVGVNGKRGNVRDLSMDPIVFPVHSGGVRDGGGSFASIAIIDLIGAAGGDDAHLAWIDVTDETRAKGDIGAFVLPFASAPIPAPGPLPPSPPPAVNDLSVIKAELATLIEQQQVLMHALAGVATKADVDAAKDALWGFLADKVIAEQFGDLRKLVAESGGGAAPTACRFPRGFRGAGVLRALEDMPDNPTLPAGVES